MWPQVTGGAGVVSGREHMDVLTAFNSQPSQDPFYPHVSNTFSQGECQIERVKRR